MSKYYKLLLAGTVAYAILLLLCSNSGEHESTIEGRLIIRTYTILWYLRCTAGYLIFAVLTIGHKLLNTDPRHSNPND